MSRTNRAGQLLRLPKRGLYLVAPLTALLVFGPIDITLGLAIVREPKVVLFLFISALCAVGLIFPRRHSDIIKVSPQHILCLAFVVLNFISIRSSVNVGLYLQATAYWVSALVLSLYIHKADFKVAFLAKLLIIPVSLTLVSALQWILFKYSLLGGQATTTIGSKNPSSVFLAQSLPLLLILVKKPKRDFFSTSYVLFIVSIISLCVWVILANRTRSAWWMLGLYLVALLWIAFKKKQQARWRFTFACYSSALIVGVTLLIAVPNKLTWKSDRPYWTSLSTMASLKESSGRDKLWRVGLTMLSEHPIRGVGAGNTAQSFGSYIEKSGVNPKVFGVTVQKNLFNDYLQAAVEAGLFAGAVFFLMTAGLSAWLLKKCIDLSGIRSHRLALASLSGLAISADAFVDLPFNRPENLILFTLVTAACVKGLGAAGKSITLDRQHLVSAFSYAAVAMSLYLFTIAARLGTSIALSTSDNLSTTRLAYQLWPWRHAWQAVFVNQLLAHDRTDEAERFVNSRIRNWPNDPISYHVQAAFYERTGKLDDAVVAYRRAIVSTENGQCDPIGFQAYLRFTARNRAKNVREMSADELSVCTREAPGYKN